MRAAIFDSLFARMATDDSIMLVVADMGLGLIERFQETYPDRFLNVGIAERSMIGAASGLSNVGFRVFCYTVSNFAVSECFAALRNEACLNQTPLIIMGTTVGFDNAALGPTHHTIDDWASVKALPGMSVFCPSSVAYAETMVDRALAEAGPCYIRIAKGSFRDTVRPKDVVHYRGSGDETVVVTCGAMVPSCMRAFMWTATGIVVVNKLHPLPEEMADHLAPYNRIIVVEDQVRQGLYSSICELQPRGTVEFVGPDGFDLVVKATPEAHWKRWGMDSASLLERIG